MKRRLDHAVVRAGLAPTRSQAESWIRLGKVLVGGKVVSKPGYFVDESESIVPVSYTHLDVYKRQVYGGWRTKWDSRAARKHKC